MKKSTVLTQKKDNRLEILFRHAGLTDKQATLYRLLLASGDERASVLSRKSGINRTTVYVQLKDLVLRGIVSIFEKGKIEYFHPEPPEKITEFIDAREKEAAAGKKLAADIVPELTSQWKQAVGKPVVRSYFGEAGIRKVLDEVYAPGKPELVGCLGAEELETGVYREIIQTYMPLRVRRKIFARSISPDSPRARELAREANKHLKEKFLCDPRRYPMPAEIDVWGEKIAFLSFVRGDFVGLLIENPQFATTLASVFRLLFDTLRERGGGTGSIAGQPTAHHPEPSYT